MLNQVALIGTLSGKPIYSTDNPDKTPYKIFVKIDTGEEIAVYIWASLADTITEKYSVGTLLGVKGSLKVYNGQLIVVAERISFMTAQEN